MSELEKKLKAKVQESIGDLITDEDLTEIIERGIEEALFRRRRVPKKYGGYEERPGLVEECVNKYFEDQVRKAVDHWLEEHPERLQEAIQVAVEGGVASAVMRTLDRRMGKVFVAGAERMEHEGLLPVGAAERIGGP